LAIVAKTKKGRTMPKRPSPMELPNYIYTPESSHKANKGGYLIGFKKLPNYIYTPEASHKSNKGQSLGYLNGIAYLTPGRGICHNYNNCLHTCYFNSGRLKFGNVANAMAQRSYLWRNDPETFIMMLKIDLLKHVSKAQLRGLIPAFRLNGTSDIDTQSLGLIEKFPHVQFYDYTKDFSRRSRYSNYHLTYSFDGTNHKDCRRKLELGFNVAVVFNEQNPEDFPPSFWGYPVINGHDLRFLDPSPVVVGLTPKGMLRKQDTGMKI
jgi:hypothetical protein